MICLWQFSSKLEISLLCLSRYFLKVSIESGSLLLLINLIKKCFRQNLKNTSFIVDEDGNVRVVKRQKSAKKFGGR